LETVGTQLAASHATRKTRNQYPVNSQEGQASSFKGSCNYFRYGTGPSYAKSVAYPILFLLNPDLIRQVITNPDLTVPVASDLHPVPVKI